MYHLTPVFTNLHNKKGLSDRGERPLLFGFISRIKLPGDQNAHVAAVVPPRMAAADVEPVVVEPDVPDVDATAVRVEKMTPVPEVVWHSLALQKKEGKSDVGYCNLVGAFVGSKLCYFCILVSPVG